MPKRKRPLAASRVLRRFQNVELLVLCMTFQWMEVGKACPWVLDVALPPLAVTDNSARTLWEAIRQHPALQSLVRFKRELLLAAAASDSGLSVSMNQCDDASAHRRFFSRC